MPGTKDKYKEAFATAVAAAFEALYPSVCQTDDGRSQLTAESVHGYLEAPKDPAMGRFSLPVFRFAKLLREKPQDIASKLMAAVNERLSAGSGPGLTAEAVGGFLNARLDPVQLSRETIKAVLSAESDYGSSDIGRGQKYLVEYSSPNIAKPFGIGHLRSTIIGHSLRRIYKKLGYDVLGINYPGDWGTQFGKMIVAYRKWGDEHTLEGEAVKKLLELYVRFHREAHEDKSLDDEAREAFQKLESGDPDARALWERFKDVSYAEFARIYGKLGIEFDWTYGESVLNDRMEPMIERLKKAGLTSISESALVVQLPDEQLPPLLLRKSDGATLYATRDLAGLAYRWEKYPGFHESLYVVNVAQSDHFKQCLMAIDLLETAEQLPPDRRMTGRVKHIDFGWVRFEGQMMSTRKGNTVLLDDVIDEATELAGKIIREKNPELPDADATARMIGNGAVIFSQLSVRRQRDIDFRWDEVLTFEGETGPYLQYTHARLSSVLRKFGDEVSHEVDYNLLSGEEEQRVVELLADFPVVIADAGRQYEPYFISGYLLKLAAAFNKIYQRKDDQGRIDKFISEDEQLTRARMALVKSVQTVVAAGLYLLGLDAPSEM